MTRRARRLVVILTATAAAVVAAVGCKDGAGDEELDRAALARQVLDDGHPRRALALVESAEAGAELIVRMQALIELDEWGTFDKLLRKVTAGPERDALACLQAAARRDVWAVKACRAPFSASALGPTLFDHTQRSLGRALEVERRKDEAELVLRKLAETHPSTANKKAVVSFLERQGYLRQAVAYLDAWARDDAHDKSLALKLVQVLERKVRGDLLERRPDEAEAAARRILELAPERAQIRYFLADALEMKGETTQAAAERAAAKAAGATPPVPVDAMPGPAWPEVPDDDHDHHHP